MADVLQNQFGGKSDAYATPEVKHLSPEEAAAYYAEKAVESARLAASKLRDDLLRIGVLDAFRLADSIQINLIETGKGFARSKHLRVVATICGETATYKVTI